MLDAYPLCPFWSELGARILELGLNPTYAGKIVPDKALHL